MKKTTSGGGARGQGEGAAQLTVGWGWGSPAQRGLSPSAGAPRPGLCPALEGEGCGQPTRPPPLAPRLTVPQAADPVHNRHLDDKGKQVIDEGVEGLVGEHAPGQVGYGLELVVDEELGCHGDEACGVGKGTAMSRVSLSRPF